ncbi:MAG: GerMN domain-containing protein [Lachnospiraceae bacterium]|nr:GerMN domain-containing protein [Lachnospiraceae bacterium]
MKRCIIVCVLVVLFGVAGCGKKTEHTTVVKTDNESLVWIYYPTSDGISARTEQYQIKQPDSISAAVEEAMTALASDTWGFPVQYHTFMLDSDNNLMLDFYSESMLDATSCLLMDASVCQTLFQLPELKSISIRLLMADDTELSRKTYERDSFYFYGYEETGLNNKSVTIYYPSKTGGALASGPVNVHQDMYTSIPEQIVSVLASRGVLPANTAVNAVIFQGGICYLDLNEAFISEATYEDGKMIVYSLVNSITAEDGVDALQILVEGEKITSYCGFSEMEEPLRFDSSIVQ